MGNIVKTAKCRFCGQMTQIEADEELTAAQAEEQATMTYRAKTISDMIEEETRLNRLVNGGAA